MLRLSQHARPLQECGLLSKGAGRRPSWRPLQGRWMLALAVGAMGAAWAWAGAAALQYLPLEPQALQTLLQYKSGLDAVLAGALLGWLLLRWRRGGSRRTLARRVEQVLRHAPSGMARLSMDGRLVWANERLREWLGVAPHEPLPQVDFRTLVRPHDSDWAQRQLQRLRAGEIDHYQGERWCRNQRDGSQLPVLCTVSHVLALESEPDHLVCVLQSLREVHAARDAQALSEQRWRLAATVVDNTIEGVVVTDADGRILSVNPAVTRLMGYTEEELLGQNPRVFKSGRHGPAFYEAMWDTMRQTGHWQGEIWNRRKNGEVFPERMSLSAVRGADGAVTHYVCMFTDISEEKAQHQRLEFLAHCDPLTGLPNRAWFGEQLDSAVRQAQDSGEQMALLLLNLDRFKDVNDSYGHAVGDEVLRHITRQVEQNLRPGDLLGRLAGDEIAVLARHLRHADGAAAVARHLIAAASTPWCTPDGIEVVVGVSVGICMFPAHARTTEALLQGAHSSVYGAKARGRGAYCFFDESLIQAARERLEIEARLRVALAQGHLRLYYQPQVCIATGRIMGAEALVRWLDPQEGMISPARFIPVAETSGVIGPLGQWVMRAACEQGQRWRADGLPEIRLAINLSPRQFQLTDVAACAAEALKASGFPARCLELELTESVLAERPDEIRAVLQRLQQLGVRMAVDDFGTGYSSLAHLKRFPIDVLKIDQGFIRDIPRSADDMAISAAIVAMGHSLGLSVLAEGVETPQQLAFLRERGCDAYQGYLCSRPLPAEEFARLLQAHNGMAG